MEGTAVLDGFGEVGELDVIAAVKIGNGAGNAQDAVEAAGAPAELGGGALEELGGGVI